MLQCRLVNRECVGSAAIHADQIIPFRSVMNRRHSQVHQEASRPGMIMWKRRLHSYSCCAPQTARRLGDCVSKFEILIYLSIMIPQNILRGLSQTKALIISWVPLVGALMKTIWICTKQAIVWIVHSSICAEQNSRNHPRGEALNKTTVCASNCNDTSNRKTCRGKVCYYFLKWLANFFPRRWTKKTSETWGSILFFHLG